MKMFFKRPFNSINSVGVIVFITIVLAVVSIKRNKTSLLLAKPVGTSYWGLPGLDVLFSTPFPEQTSIYSYWCAYVLAVSLIGAQFLRLFVSTLRRYDIVTLLMTGFIPGYLIAVAINRLVTLGLPHATAPLVCLGIVCILGLIALAMWVRDPTPIVSTYSIFPISALIITHVLQLQIAHSHVGLDATALHLSLLPDKTSDLNGHFPILANHYDEPVFIYPMHALFFITRTSSALFQFWITTGFFKASAATLIFLLVRQITTNTLFSVIFVLYIGFAGLVINPIEWRLLFDSENALLMPSHPGRVLSGLLPILALFPLTFEFSKPESIFKKAILLFLTLLAGVGLSATCAANVLTFVSLVGAVCLCRSKAVKPREIRIQKRAPGLVQFAVSLILLIFPSLMYEYSGPNSSYFALGGVAVMMLALFFLFLQAGIALPHVRTLVTDSLLVPVAAGIGGGLALLGNLLIPRTYPMFGIRTNFVAPKVEMEFSLAKSYECGNFPLEHCASFWNFFRDFGFFVALMTITISYGFSKSMSKPPNNDNSQACLSDSLKRYIIILFAFFIVSLFAYDFTSNYPGWRPWVKSRLVEPWFYGGISACLIYLFLNLKPVAAKLLTGLLVCQITVFNFLPFYGPGFLLHQLKINMDYLLLKLAQ
jgi:hypothetical protein